MKMRSMEEIIAHFHHTMNSTEMTVVRAQLANLESIRRQFRAIWFTDAIRFIQSKHFQEVALEFWLHENWLVSLGLLVEDDNQLPGMSLQLLKEHTAADEQMLRTPFKVVRDEHRMKVISLFLPRLVGNIGVEASHWLKLQDEEERFAHCCLMLQKYIQIASQGGLLWEDLISSESVGTQLLGKNDKLRNRTVAEDLVIGSFKPVSIVIWNVRNAQRDHFANAVMDLRARNLADVIFLFNSRLTSNGAVQGILETLPYDTQYSTTEQDLRGGSIVMWNGSQVNLLCEGWKYAGEVNSWVSVVSQLEDGTW
ncbi:hypothetical protein SLEP1_g8759 [Rubroshorea leprosula]|uniref:Uncharacterized protein n=1 Tax=Rubroshorea leprosula TaxID=152421 RepID=A0AAV5I788_9ROSI|nr:hypothetical protein SLEP1_g8759 [Rubroshorea leprosula]